MHKHIYVILSTRKSKLVGEDNERGLLKQKYSIILIAAQEPDYKLKQENTAFPFPR